MCIRDRFSDVAPRLRETLAAVHRRIRSLKGERLDQMRDVVKVVCSKHGVKPDRLLLVIDDVAGLREGEGAPVSYTHLRAHETVLDLVCRLLLEKTTTSTYTHIHNHLS